MITVGGIITAALFGMAIGACFCVGAWLFIVEDEE